jgi:hypothetical protein
VTEPLAGRLKPKPKLKVMWVGGIFEIEAEAEVGSEVEFEFEGGFGVGSEIEFGADL